MKHRFFLIILTIICICLFIAGTSYALFIKMNENKNDQVIKSGDLRIKYESSSEIIVDKDENGKSLIVPLLDEDGMMSDIYTFTITNTGTLTANYRINITNGEGDNLVDWKYIRYSLDESAPEFLSNINNNVLYSSNIKLGQTRTFNLRVWVWMERDASTGEYIGAPNDIEGQSIHLVLNIEGNVFECETIELSDLSKSISNNMDKYCLSDNMIYYYGDNDFDNYVQFADNLWRIIRINKDGSLRLISNDVVGYTVYSNNSSINQLYDFGDTTIKTALEDYYNNNLKDYSDYLALSEYCNDGLASYNNYYNGNKDLNCTIEYESYIGLLSIKEYALLNKSVFGINKNYWIYNIDNTLEYSIINEDGNYSVLNNSSESGLRPVINLKDGLLTYGDGTINNPYRINN